jgi:hypothetical protein
MGYVGLPRALGLSCTCARTNQRFRHNKFKHHPYSRKSIEAAQSKPPAGAQPTAANRYV